MYLNIGDKDKSEFCILDYFLENLFFKGVDDLYILP